MSLNPYESPREVAAEKQLPTESTFGDQHEVPAYIFWPMMTLLGLGFSGVPAVGLGVFLSVLLGSFYGDYVPPGVQVAVLATCASAMLVFVVMFLRMVAGQPAVSWWMLLPALALATSAATMVLLVMADLLR